MARPTRFAELGYEKQDTDCWRIIDMSTGSAVGPIYRTKTELLCDLDLYAAVFGCDMA